MKSTRKRKGESTSDDESSAESPTKKRVKSRSNLPEDSADMGKRVNRFKCLKKIERVEEARKAYKWWEAPKLASGINWNYMEHPGISFPPAYQPHHIPLLYKGKEVVLNSEQEEIASFYAAMPEDGPQLGNAKTRPVFQKNFFEDFRAVLGPNHVVQDFKNCDFSLIKRHLEVQKSLRKVATDDEKQQKKDEKEKANLRFGYALIDGRIEKVP